MTIEIDGLAAPRIGLGYRIGRHDAIIAHLAHLDLLEVTLDHYFWAGPAERRRFEGLIGRRPLVAHGIGLSLGTDRAPDGAYLERVAGALARFRAPYYSEHLAFTGVPGLELANLLPLPRTEAVAERMIENVRRVRSFVAVPFLLENITYYFDYPDSTLGEAEFLRLVCRESGAGILLDVENLYLNSVNHGYDARAFVDALEPGSVRAVHVAGGGEYEGVLVDTHDQPAPEGALALLDHLLARQHPEAIILERDRRLDAFDEVLADVARIRGRVAAARAGTVHVQPAPA